MSTLASYLERKTAALKAARASASPNQEERMQHLTAQCTAEGGSGIRRVRIRDFQIITDAGPAMAGYDLGPRSPEVLLGALGSCTGCGTLSGLEKSGEKVFMKYARFDTSSSERLGQAGIEV